MLTFRWRTVLFAVVTGLVALPLALGALLVALIWPNLPDMQALTDYHPKLPMRVYTADGTLLAEFGEQRRALVTLAQTPAILQHAILAAEDDRFYQHGAIDATGVLRAALANLVSGGAREGASTITMQVARNFFLSREKTWTRKLNEALLSVKIERNLTKDQILTLYINQIYLGQRAYGFAAASQAYFGKPLSQIDIAQAAMLAGLPKAPSRYNPVANMPRALARQHYVLSRMHALHYITDAEYEAAMAEKLKVRKSPEESWPVSADYVAEMIRQVMYDKYHDAIYTSGMRVYTTLRRRDQIAADNALWQGVEEYDRRHGYRGPEGTVPLPPTGEENRLDATLQDVLPVHDLLPAILLDTGAHRARVWVRNAGMQEIGADGLKFAERALTGWRGHPATLRPGALIRVLRRGSTAPQPGEGALDGEGGGGADGPIGGGVSFDL